MPTKQTIAALVVGGLMAWGGAGALAELPNGRTLTYDVGETPGDFDSPLVYEYEMHLTAQQQSGNSIGWAVDSVTIRELDENETVINTWVDSAPNIDSTDGLWWVAHADPANPVLGEFAESPSIDGTAGSEMDYEFQGTGQAQAGVNINVLVALIIWLQNQPAPSAEYEDELISFHETQDPF